VPAYRRVPLLATLRARGTTLLLTVAAAALPAQSPRTTPPAVQGYFALTRPAYSGDRARDVVAFMDQYFRLPGNTGFNASLDRVEGILKAAGFVNENEAKPGDRLTYRFERRPMARPTWEPIDATVRIVGESAPLLSYKKNRNMLAINSGSTGDTGIAAAVVDVGTGTPAEYDRTPVAGKIVLVEGAVGAAYAEAVVKRRAAGVFAYRMPAYTKPEVHRNSIQFSSINDTTGAGWGILLSRNALDRLRAALAKGVVTASVATKTRMYRADDRTLVAEVRGSARPDERFVLSAHVQEPGANDNASGVGTLSEMARVMATLVRARSIDPKRTITMLFGNEISQTRNYLAADSVRTRGVRWGLSLDMTGEDTKKTGGTFLIEKMPDPSAIWTRGDDKHSEWGGSPLKKSDLKPHYFNDYLIARCLDQAATTGWVVRTNPFEGGSDHTPFLQFNKPGVLFWHFTDVFYHTDGDRLENVSAATMSNVGNAALASVLTLVSADGATTRALVGEVEQAATRRLAVERALGEKAVAGGGDAAAESDILATWIDYYGKSIDAMRDIEVGGSSPETEAAIAAAASRVRKMNATITPRP
jgi:hypothetical protein